MEFSELTIRILFLFFPGIICTLIVDNLTIHRERRAFTFIVHSFIFGLSCYLIYYFVKFLLDQVIWITTFVDPRVTFLDALMERNQQLDYLEIIKTTVYVSIPLGLIVTLLLNRKVFHRFAKLIRVTRKFGEVGVWEYTFNLPNIEWVRVRDIKNDLVFQGWVQAFSDSADDNEMLLRDVTVFRNSTGKELYKIGGLYLARERGELTIEFPQIELTESAIPKSSKESDLWTNPKLKSGRKKK